MANSLLPTASLMLLAPLFAWLLNAAVPMPTPVVAVPAVARPAESEFCQIYGAVYLERDPSRRAYCAFIAYEEPEEGFADLNVFKEDNKLFADQPGLWYITPTREFADYVVFITPNRAFADFAIHYTTARTFAGCRK